MTATIESKDINIVRTYDAPLRAVWDAWTDPEQVARWWGPRGFTLTTYDKDLRSGGSWTYTMHGPDGTDYPNKTLYLDVEPMARLVYDHGGNDDRPALFRVTVLFTEADGKTHMDMTMHFPDAAAARQAAVFIRQAGGNATWDRLAEYLARRWLDQECFVINRSFDVPRERMFDMWTTPTHLAQWIGPAGCETRFLRADIPPGDSTQFCTTGAGIALYALAHCEEIRRPDRIVYTQQFCDEHEHVACHPLAPVWPATMRTIVELTAEGLQRTRVTITSCIGGQATTAELAAFVNARGGMAQGWTGSFDKLEAVLARPLCGR